RTPIALTDNEKIMVLSVHRYLQKNMPKLKSKEATNLRKEVSLATGVGEATVARVVADFNKTGKIVSSKQDQRAPKEFQAEYVDKIHDLVISANRSGFPLSLKFLVQELFESGFKR
ncbi:34555_t:CDS:1, partial [Racocetra persica]